MNPISGLFDERNPRLHVTIRRKLAAAVSLSLDNQASSLTSLAGSNVMLSIGNITFGNRFGFLDEGEAKQGIMKSISSYLKYASRVGIFPEWHQTLFRLFIKSKKLNGLAHVQSFGKENLEARSNESALKYKRVNTPGLTDFVSKFQQICTTDSSKISKDEIALACSISIGAGSDTTSISLSAIIYYLTLYPETMRKLRNEIKDMATQNLLSNPITFQESCSMPYLQAVIKEALRLHPVTGLILGRVVPKGGAMLSGIWFPEGSVVGVNLWVGHLKKEIFGSDADGFHPERWLGDPEVVRRRESYFMTFGMGSRTCIGKNISIMELSKVVPELVRAFDFVPESGIPQWATEDVWFVKPRGYRCRIKLRDEV
ncbi:hypothetical protein N7520_005933 [Penicillium odoratum]|uniref:uncharacterized protein n=1 Tax=Penicillium odoratum TaxID=1167516 RepID=UPI002548B868|nr:uncharacterized protein N7520_005933 [Penicillium odoratum]KAJ5758777.1 hypothetical protein N7520_005933 [Penicillium odoratum]